MSGDDYMLALYYRDHGFFGTQQVVYTHWTGRYTATFIGALFMKFGWPQRYYFLHPLLLFLCTWGALFSLLSTVNRYLLRRLFTRAGMALASGVLLMVTIYVQAETATGFYWFSSAVTYQPAFIFFLLLTAALIRRFRPGGAFDPSGNPRAISDSRPRRHWRGDAVILLLILLIIGCNEIAAVFLIFFLLLLITGHYYYRRSVPVSLVVYAGMSIVMGAIILLTSGLLSVRYSYMNPNTPAAAVLPMILFRGAAVFYYILKVPLFWIGCSVLYLIGRRAAASLPGSPFLSFPGPPPSDRPTAAASPSSQGRKILIPCLVAIPVLVLLTLTAILMVSKGALPDRALNNLSDLAAVLLLGLAFIAGLSSSAPSVPPSDRWRPPDLGARQISVPPISAGSPVLSPTALLVVVVVGLMASDSFPEAWRNDLSGYFYHSVEAGRIQKMEEARVNRQKTIVLPPYDEALQAEIHRVFPHGTFKTMMLLLKERPSFLFRGKDPDLIDPMRRYYYNLDSVTVKSPKM